MDEYDRGYNNTIGEHEIVIRGTTEQYGYQDFSIIRRETPEYLHAIKQLAQKVVYAKSGLRNEPKIASYFPEIQAYIDANPQMSYTVHIYGVKKIDTPFGYLLPTNMLDGVADEFRVWYLAELEKIGIKKDGETHTIPAKYTVDNGISHHLYHDAWAMAQEVCKQHGWNIP
ncbi:MAG: hypothetical protein Q4B81_00175 [Moraxella sp.]|nr:hypothetical protein [Moraxella sp.]